MYKRKKVTSKVHLASLEEHLLSVAPAAHFELPSLYGAWEKLHLVAKVHKGIVAVLFGGIVGILFDTPSVSDLMKRRQLA